MDYKQKYEQALERAKCYKGLREEMAIVFPELKESDDERIKKNCIHFLELQKKHHVATFEIEECIVWLEKQGLQKQRKEWDADDLLDYNQIMHILQDCNQTELMDWLEKQGEQKQTLPKWKYKKDNTPLLRDSIILNKYGCVAKSPSGALVSDVWVMDYDELVKLPKEETEKQGKQNFTNCHFTLEQTDILNKHIDEFLEQKPIWNEEDKRMIDTIIYDLERHGGKEDSCYSAEINWLKSLKERMKGE